MRRPILLVLPLCSLVLGFLALGFWALAPRVAAEDQPGGSAANDPRLTREQLKELVGPIALYPDVVLSALLPASAFPFEVAAAARWRARQPEGAAQIEAPASEVWDESVKALLQFPDVLVWLDENLEWYAALGRAMATQQQEVLVAIQEFRADAERAGNLRTDDKVIVTHQGPPQGQGFEAPPPDAVAPIVIQPANPQVVYIPVYEPAVVLVPAPRPVVTWGIGFQYANFGLWLRHEIWWPWYRPASPWWYGSIWYHASPWWWGRPRPSTWAWTRPLPWYSPTWRYGSYSGWHAGYRPPMPRAPSWRMQTGSTTRVRYVTGVRTGSISPVVPGAVRPAYRPMSRPITLPASQSGAPPGTSGVRRPALLPSVRSTGWPAGRQQPAILRSPQIRSGTLPESLRGHSSLRVTPRATPTAPVGPAVGLPVTPRARVLRPSLLPGSGRTLRAEPKSRTTPGGLMGPGQPSAADAAQSSARGRTSIMGTRR